MGVRTALLLGLLLAACHTGALDGADTGEGRDAAPDDGVGGELAAPCGNEGTAGALADCLRPTMSPEYYVEQALKYFDTLDVDADPESIPNYAEQVARWEWPPWLLLTGYERANLIETAALLRLGDPSTVPERDCRFFPVQPFARCYVVFQYEGGPCPIYEEFVFNDAGEMTFIEAWSDLDGLRPTPEDDPWGERHDIGRLSTRLPGLGTPEGRVDLESEWLRAAAAQDPEIADFALRAADFWRTWAQALLDAEEEFFARGCGW